MIFIFLGKLYDRCDGVAMGSPLEPMSFNVFVCNFGNISFKNCASNFKPIVYRPFVDDTILLFWSKDHFTVAVKLVPCAKIYQLLLTSDFVNLTKGRAENTFEIGSWFFGYYIGCTTKGNLDLSGTHCRVGCKVKMTLEA